MSVFVDIEKELGSFHLNVSFSGDNEVVALLGASGCGKSMTLKCIAGIEKPDRGKIAVDGVTLFDSDKKINLSPQERHTGLLFQNYALFPNMTVLQNIRAGAKREKDKSRRESLCRDFIQSFGLSELLNHYPHQLSGGQQQRTALARILVSSPNILLLDEPFSALDSHLRFRLEQEVRSVIRKFGRTVILVSHDRDEVFRLSDKIAVMNNGSIDCFGAKKEVFANPRTRAAAALTGCKNISPAKIIDSNHVRASDWGIDLSVPSIPPDTEYVGIRMHDIRPGPGANSFICRVVSEIENPFSYTVMLTSADGQGKAPFGWELDKELWRSLRREALEVCLPEDSIILLKG